MKSFSLSDKVSLEKSFGAILIRKVFFVTKTPKNIKKKSTCPGETLSVDFLIVRMAISNLFLKVALAGGEPGIFWFSFIFSLNFSATRLLYPPPPPPLTIYKLRLDTYSKSD